MALLNKIRCMFWRRSLTKCGACAYWQFESGMVGRCHAKPPCIWHFGAEQNSVAEFPLVNCVNFCGHASRVSDAEIKARKQQMIDASSRKDQIS